MDSRKTPDKTKSCENLYAKIIIPAPLLSERLTKDHLDRLHALFQRFELHEKITPKLQKWRKNYPFNQAAKKILAALGEIEAEIPEADEALKHLRMQYLEQTLLKAEILQLSLIQRARGHVRDLNGKHLSDLQQALRQTREKVRADRKAYLKAHRAKSKGKLFTSIFFKRPKQHALSDTTITTTKKTYRLVDVANAINNFFARFLNAAQPLLRALRVIPFIDALATAVPLTLIAIKSWLHAHDWRDKLSGVILIGVAYGILVVAGLSAFGASLVFGGGIIAGLMGVSFYEQYLSPWLKNRAFIKKYHAEAGILKKASEALILGLLDQPLTSIEKECLIKFFEEKYLAGSLSLSVTESFIQELAQTPPITVASMQDNFKRQFDINLQSYLLKALNQHQLTLDATVLALKAEQRAALPLGLSSAVNLLGATLIAIPTPPTWIAGAILILLSVCMSAWVAFDVTDRIRATFFKKQVEGMPTPDSTPHGSTRRLGKQMKIGSELAQETDTEPSPKKEESSTAAHTGDERPTSKPSQKR